MGQGMAIRGLSLSAAGQVKPENRVGGLVKAECFGIVRTLYPRGYHIKKTPSFEGVFFYAGLKRQPEGVHKSGGSPLSIRADE